MNRILPSNSELAPTISGHVDLSELAASILENTGSSPDVREFIIGKVVWNHGLAHFEGVLKRATQIQLHDVLNAKDFHYGPQIFTAFEARNLVEHRDGKVDRRFREADSKELDLRNFLKWRRGHAEAQSRRILRSFLYLGRSLSNGTTRG